MSGGDPLAPCNIEFTKEFLSKTSLDVCIYTGHSIEYVKKHNVKGFKFVKCGKFEYENLRESYKTDELIQFASPNQCLYDGEYNLLSENGIYKF
jgi:organic radical activating enzyme